MFVNWTAVVVWKALKVRDGELVFEGRSKSIRIGLSFGDGGRNGRTSEEPDANKLGSPLQDVDSATMGIEDSACAQIILVLHTTARVRICAAVVAQQHTTLIRAREGAH